MKILVVSLQKFGDHSMECRHTLIDITRETRTSYCVIPSAALEGRKYIRKEDIEQIVVETDGKDISARVWALNEVEDVSKDLLRYWKREVKNETMRFLKSQNQHIKQAYQEVINI